MHRVNSAVSGLSFSHAPSTQRGYRCRVNVSQVQFLCESVSALLFSLLSTFDFRTIDWILTAPPEGARMKQRTSTCRWTADGTAPPQTQHTCEMAAVPVVASGDVAARTTRLAHKSGGPSRAVSSGRGGGEDRSAAAPVLLPCLYGQCVGGRKWTAEGCGRQDSGTRRAHAQRPRWPPRPRRLTTYQTVQYRHRRVLSMSSKRRQARSRRRLTKTTRAF